MKTSQVAVQLFTLREHCKTAVDLAATCAKVREIGYQAVQVSCVGDIPEKEIATIISDAGLVLCATHEPGIKILEEPDAVIERMHKLRCDLTAYPFPAGVDFTSRPALDALVRRLDDVGAMFRRAGITLGYHNHGIEFCRVPGTDRIFLDYLFERASPEHLVAEPDTYWLQHGGGNPVDWMRKLKGRMPFMHLKDYTYDPRANQPMFCEIGAGNLPFKEIIREARESGCRWFIVEQDRTPGDQFVSIKQSFDYIQKHLID